MRYELWEFQVHFFPCFGKCFKFCCYSKLAIIKIILVGPVREHVMCHAVGCKFHHVTSLECKPPNNDVILFTAAFFTSALIPGFDRHLVNWKLNAVCPKLRLLSHLSLKLLIYLVCIYTIMSVSLKSTAFYLSRLGPF